MSNSAATHDRSERTATSAFGVGRRESHDASEFYARFESPEVSASEDITVLDDLAQGPDACIGADSRRLVLPDGNRLPDNCVALVVTSPPYFSGKEYERALGSEGVPGSYLQYLELLRQVFAECKRVLEPGGRIAVNVANLGRKPYRSLASDVVRILQDDLRLLLRGEIVWRKGEGANGSCAWGSYLSARNPVLRDTTERVILASKERFDRAKAEKERKQLGLPFENDIAADEFMDATLDVWNIPPESAKRVEHPAPFPVALPERVIGLYTYVGDVVLDPFMGSGSTVIAAMRTGRRYLGYDTDPRYVSIARARVENEPGDRHVDLRPAAARAKPVVSLAEDTLIDAGFAVVARDIKLRGVGVRVDLVARDGRGHEWFFEVIGSYTMVRNGLARTDAAWNAIGKASALARAGKTPVVLLSTHMPAPKSEADAALRAVGPAIVFDALELLDEGQRGRLARYAQGGREKRPAIGFWKASDVELM